ncbi:MAG: GNAT family N-acetyltransferase [Pseudomonadota bacterium]
MVEVPDCRTLDAADLDRLRAHFRTCWVETYGTRLDPHRLRAMCATLAEPSLGGVLAADARLAFAREDGEIIATGLLADRGSSARLWGCYTRRARQRRGIGQRILGALIEGVRDVRSVEATVLDGSSPARAFYAKHGFVEQSPTSIEIAPGRSLPARVLTAEVARLRLPR